MFVTIAIGIFSVIAFLVYFYRDKEGRELINKLPGPPTLPILGNAHQLRIGHEWYKQCLHFSEEYKDTGVFRLWLANKPIVAISRPEFVESILSSNKHITKSSEYNYIHPWLGTGLLTSTGEKWRSHRKMLTPTFHFHILHDFVDVFNKKSDILISKLSKKVDTGPYNVFQDVALCALDIISETAMGKDIDCQRTDSEYVHAVYRMSTLVDQRMRFPWNWNDFFYTTFGNGKEEKAKLKILHDFTNAVINDRLKDFDSKKLEIVRKEMSGKSDVGQKKVRLAFLDMLLYVSENLTKLSLEEIREEVDTFMFEGHDTTAAAINWAIHLLGADKDKQNKLQEELDNVFGGSDRHPTMDDLKELKYLDCCIKETLRLYPSVPLYARALEEAFSFDKYTIPNKTTVVVMTAAMQRSPEVFKNPNTFDPDRFLLENIKSKHPYSYVPFSAGPRNCIGQKFAQLEMKVVLSSIFRQFNITSKQETSSLRPVGELILRPEKGIVIEITKRTL